MSERSTPIVPTVFTIGTRKKPYELAPITRYKLLYATPTTVRGQPGKGQAETIQQAAAYCLPDDPAWDRVTAAHEVLRLAFAGLGDEARRLGTYRQRLKEAGGYKKASNPLSPTVIAMDEPDGTVSWWFEPTRVPNVKRVEIEYHTREMLREKGKDYTGTNQSNHIICPTDADWQVVDERHRAAVKAEEIWNSILKELGTYREASADGRYANLAPVSAPAMEIVPAPPPGHPTWPAILSPLIYGHHRSATTGGVTHIWQPAPTDRSKKRHQTIGRCQVVMTEPPREPKWSQSGLRLCGDCRQAVPALVTSPLAPAEMPTENMAEAAAGVAAPAISTPFAQAVRVLEAHGVAVEALGEDERTRTMIWRVGNRECDRDGVIALAQELAAKPAVPAEQAPAAPATPAKIFYPQARDTLRLAGYVVTVEPGHWLFQRPGSTEMRGLLPKDIIAEARRIVAEGAILAPMPPLPVIEQEAAAIVGNDDAGSGALVPVGTVIIPIVMMDASESRECLAAIRTDLDAAEASERSARSRLLDWKEREGWAVLGHDTFVDGVRAEIGPWGKAHIYRLVNAALVERVLGIDQSPTGDSPEVPERQLRELVVLLDDPAALREAWERANQIAGEAEAPRTATHVAQAVAEQLVPVIEVTDEPALFERAEQAHSIADGYLNRGKIKRPFTYQDKLWISVGGAYGPNGGDYRECVRVVLKGEPYAPGETPAGMRRGAYTGDHASFGGGTYVLTGQWLIVRRLAVQQPEQMHPEVPHDLREIGVSVRPMGDGFFRIGAAEGPLQNWSSTAQRDITVLITEAYQELDERHVTQARKLLADLSTWDEAQQTRIIQEAYSHARQIRDLVRREALFAEVDRAVDAAKAPAVLPAGETTEQIREIKALVRAAQGTYYSYYLDQGYHVGLPGREARHYQPDELRRLFARLTTPEQPAEHTATPTHSGGGERQASAPVEQPATPAPAQPALPAERPALPTPAGDQPLVRPRQPASGDVSVVLGYLRELERYVDADDERRFTAGLRDLVGDVAMFTWQCEVMGETIDAEGCATLAAVVRAIANRLGGELAPPVPDGMTVCSILKRANELAGPDLDALVDDLDDPPYEALAAYRRAMQAAPALEASA